MIGCLHSRSNLLPLPQCLKLMTLPKITFFCKKFRSKKTEFQSVPFSGCQRKKTDFNLICIIVRNQEKKERTLEWVSMDPGSCLSSRAVSSQVLSVYVSLTSVFGMGTGGSSQLNHRKGSLLQATWKPHSRNSLWSSPRPISIAQLHTLLYFHLRPINLVVFKGSYFVDRMGDLILRWASRLDAFSVYPVRTWLPSNAVGTTTDTPLVRPSWSSRTRDSASQISCAHDG